MLSRLAERDALTSLLAGGIDRPGLDLAAQGHALAPGGAFDAGQRGRGDRLGVTPRTREILREAQFIAGQRVQPGDARVPQIAVAQSRGGALPFLGLQQLEPRVPVRRAGHGVAVTPEFLLDQSRQAAIVVDVEQADHRLSRLAHSISGACMTERNRPS